MKVIQRNKLQTLSDELHPHSIEKYHVTLLFLQFTTTTPKICYRESDLLLGSTRGRMGRVICNLYVCGFILMVILLFHTPLQGILLILRHTFCFICCR